MNESLCCTLETNTMLLVNYISIKTNQKKNSIYFLIKYQGSGWFLGSRM